MNKIMLRFSRRSRVFSLFKIWVSISDLIHALVFEKCEHLKGFVLIFFNLLKQRGFTLLPFTIRSSFPPVAFTKKAQVFQYLEFLPPRHLFLFSFKLFSCNARHIKPVSSNSKRLLVCNRLPTLALVLSSC